MINEFERKDLLDVFKLLESIKILTYVRNTGFLK